MMEDSVGPLGSIPDHYWDAKRNRYFKGKPPRSCSAHTLPDQSSPPLSPRSRVQEVLSNQAVTLPGMQRLTY